jgi:hypothetical protein
VLLPAAVICLAGGLAITRRDPRTDPTRAALILWGGWLVVTAMVFSFMNGIVRGQRCRWDRTMRPATN